MLPSEILHKGNVKAKDYKMAKRIMNLVSEETKIPKELILARRGKAKAVLARYIYFYLLWKHTKLSQQEIALTTELKNHASIVNAKKRINLHMDKDILFKVRIREIENKLGFCIKENKQEVYPTTYINELLLSQQKDILKLIEVFFHESQIKGYEVLKTMINNLGIKV